MSGCSCRSPQIQQENIIKIVITSQVIFLLHEEIREANIAHGH